MTTTTANLVIESLGIYLPPKTESTKQVLADCRMRIKFPLEKFTGIRSRRVADGEYSIDLAQRAAEDCFRMSTYTPAEIDIVICANISRRDGADSLSYEPSTAARLSARLGIRDALMFDISNGCAGVFTALRVANALLRGRSFQRALVVSGEYITHVTRTAQLEISGFLDHRTACLTLGDAGIAMLVEPTGRGGVGFQHLDLYTMGKYAPYCVGKATDRPHGGAIMLTDAVRLNSVTFDEALLSAVRTLQQTGHTPADIQHIIMHQTSEKTLVDAAKTINRLYRSQVCTDENVVYNVAERGNTATTTHFVALHDSIVSGRVRSGDKILFSVSGSGLNIGSALYQLDSLPDRVRGVPGSAIAGPAPEKVSNPLPRLRIEAIGTAPATGRSPHSVELARVAAESSLARSGHPRAEVDVLVHTGIYREEHICEPALAAMIAGKLGINDTLKSKTGRRTVAFDLVNGTVGALNACHAVQHLFAESGAGVALITSGDIENNADAPGRELLGLREAGAALVLDATAAGTVGFGEFLFTSSADVAALSVEARHSNGVYLSRIQRDDLEDVFRTALVNIAQEILLRSALTIDDIGWVVAPQRSSEFLAALAAALGVPRERMVDACGDQGDLYTSSLAFAFAEIERVGPPAPGDRALVLAVGSGIQAGAAIYHF